MTKQHVRFARLLLEVVGKNNVTPEEFGKGLHEYRKFTEAVEATMPGSAGASKEMMGMVFSLRHVLKHLRAEGINMAEDGLVMAMIISGKMDFTGMMFHGLTQAMERSPGSRLLVREPEHAPVLSFQNVFLQPGARPVERKPLPAPTHLAPKTLQ